MIQVAILLTSYNRKEKTLACLRSVYSQESINTVNVEIYLVDDNSTDGTGEAVKTEFPNVNVFKGSGDLFWAGGMRYAWREAIKNLYEEKRTKPRAAIFEARRYVPTPYQDRLSKRGQHLQRPAGRSSRG